MRSIDHQPCVWWGIIGAFPEVSANSTFRCNRHEYYSGVKVEDRAASGISTRLREWPDYDLFAMSS